jgi:WD repeat-containing protein 92
MLSTDAPQIIEHINQGLTFTPSDTKWIPASPRFVVLGQNPKGTGALHVYELDTGECRVLHKFEKAHGLKCGTFGASSLEERRVATGDYSGQVAVWDFERDTPLFSAPKAHAGLVNAIDGCGGLNIGGGAPELVTGGADGAVRVWDPRVPGELAGFKVLAVVGAAYPPLCAMLVAILLVCPPRRCQTA